MDAIIRIPGVILTELRIISGEAGNVMHAMRSDSPGFSGFGEAYFSTVSFGATKGWKRHREMVLNLVVPHGCIKIFLYDDRADNRLDRPVWTALELSSENYQRLTVPPGIWVAFQGRGLGINLLLNLASIPHDPEEAESVPLKDLRFAEIPL